MPLIALTSCRKLEDYRQAILHVGGEVRVVDHSMAVGAALAGADGLLLSGGEDVDPSLYGESRHATVVDVDRARDDFEIALVSEARRSRLPILGICRGIQVLNVACGGTLVQDIPSERPGASDHQFGLPKHQPYDLAHEVWVDKNTTLARLLGERLRDIDVCEVNSRHHQAVKDVAPGFVAAATAPDGIIEAIEDLSQPFCLGVQWHPENFFRTGEFRALFEGFLDAATRFRQAAPSA